MCALAGAEYDGAFFNWMTPEFAAVGARARRGRRRRRRARARRRSSATSAPRSAPTPPSAWPRRSPSTATSTTATATTSPASASPRARSASPPPTATRRSEELAAYEALDTVVVRGLASANVEAMGARRRGGRPDEAPAALAASLALPGTGAGDRRSIPAAAAKPRTRRSRRRRAEGAALATRAAGSPTARGRVVILHGINMVYKVPPYRPSAIGFGADDAAFLRRYGFNTVRLGVIYKGGRAPSPGRYDDAYLRADRAGPSAARPAAASSPSSTSTRTSTTRSSAARAGPTGPSLDDGVPAEPLTGLPRQLHHQPRPQPRLRQLLGERRRPGRRRPAGPLRRRLARTSPRASETARCDDGLRPDERALARQRSSAGLRQPGGLPRLRPGRRSPPSTRR